jgi:site-specific DNA-cytosine methylase
MQGDLMLDLFAGTGGASRAFDAAGWEVVRVELDPAFPAEHHADVSTWSWAGRRPTLVWASPPCTEFARESMPWCRTGAVPSLALVDAAERIIRECRPDFWVIENVRGATRYLTPRYGRPLVLGPVFLWGRFPRFYARVRHWKERLSSTQRAQRAAIPLAVSAGLLRAIEADRAQLRMWA